MPAAIDYEALFHDLERMFKQAPGFMCVLRGERHVVQIANDTFRQIIGKGRVRGLPIRQVLPDLDEAYFDLLDGAFRSGRAFRGAGMQVQARRAPGEAPQTLYLDLVLQPIFDADGAVSGIFVQGNDVTAGIRAQQALGRHQERLEELVRERTAELARSQAALHQARQLEAVGQLTGGVAHDFNNALQVIGGNLHLLRPAVAGDPTNEQRLRLALDSVERGARLASQLLAFARRQPLAPRPVDLKRLLDRMDELLRRAVGEAVAIEIRPSSAAWTASVDPTQLENVILNLVINARDAMEGRGRLTLAIENFVAARQAADLPDALPPGEYLALSVADTGCGMSPSVRERAFQPFFTTKPAGQGTGLGLSQAYGFIRQSGGRIELDSAAGQGTTVTLYLPRSRQRPVDLDSAEPSPIEGGHETVLVVEDDPAVRATVVQMLAELGYRTLEAEDGERALAVVHDGTHVDVLFTDVVMPGAVRSEDLAHRARAKLPGLAVLFTSGYTEHSIVHDGRLDPGVTLIAKPYQREDLARKLRQLLAPEPMAAERAAAPPRARAAPKPAPRAAAEAPTSLRVLLVEDNELLRSTSAEYIREMGHEVRTCANAIDAARLLDGGPCDVLITDVNLPGKSGLELAAEIAERHPRTAIVIATGYSDLAAGEPVPGATLLPKPYDVPQLEALLKKLAPSAGAEPSR